MFSQSVCGRRVHWHIQQRLHHVQLLQRGVLLRQRLLRWAGHGLPPLHGLHRPIRRVQHPAALSMHCHAGCRMHGLLLLSLRVLRLGHLLGRAGHGVRPVHQVRPERPVQPGRMLRRPGPVLYRLHRLPGRVVRIHPVLGIRGHGLLALQDLVSGWAIPRCLVLGGGGQRVRRLQHRRLPGWLLPVLCLHRHL